MQFDKIFSKRTYQVNAITQVYHKESSLPSLSKISVPALFISSVDDPIVHPQSLQNAISVTQNNENVFFVVTKRGKKN